MQATFARDADGPVRSESAGKQAQRWPGWSSVLLEAQAAFLAGGNPNDVLACVLAKVVAVTGSAFALLGEVRREGDGDVGIETITVLGEAERASGPGKRTEHGVTASEFLDTAQTWFATQLRKAAQGGLRPAPMFLLNHVVVLPLLSGEDHIGMIGLGRRQGFDWNVAEWLNPAQIAAASFLLAARDRTRRAKAEQRLQDALDAQSNGFALFDAQDRMILHNRRFIEFFPFLAGMGDLRGRFFRDMVAIPTGETSWTPDPEAYVERRMQRHLAADGTPFDVPLENGGWVRVRETRTPDGGIVASWTDISELRAAEERLRDAISSIMEGFVFLDADLNVVICNQQFRSMHAISGHLLTVGTPFGEFLRHGAENGQFPEAQDEADGFIERMLGTFRSREPFRAEMSIGKERWALVSNRGMEDGGGVGIWTDLTEQKRREGELRQTQHRLEQKSAELARLAGALATQARRDRLTGLPNRLAFEENLGAAIQEVRQERRSHFLLFLDLDQFKIVNDAGGHAAGDTLLREVAALIQAGLAAGDFFARLGGDEFAVLRRDAAEGEAERLAQRLCRIVQDYRFCSEGKCFAIGLTIGIARVDVDTLDMQTVLAQADAACYVAKDAGGGRYHLFRAGDQEILCHKELFSAAQRIRLALAEGRLQVWLQQIVDDRGRLRGHEALVRLREGDGRILSPGAFMPAAKRFGLGAKIDQWVLSEVIRLMAAGRPSLLDCDPGYVSVNLSAKSVCDPIFRDWLVATIDTFEWLSGRLRIEITETDQLQWSAEVASFFAGLRQRGLKLYLDDFGSGYNSFDLVKKIEVDGIKIDWTVTCDILSDAVDLALVKAAVSIAASLGFELVAEGVESRAILDALRNLGVTLFQGFYFHVGEPFALAMRRVVASVGEGE